MYYSNLQVNYMVTVFIRLVMAVVYTLHLLSCSKCFVCLCPFQYRHCFLVGWCTNKSYVIATSDLWLFIHASNLLPLNSPSPLPYISNTRGSSTSGNVQFSHRRCTLMLGNVQFSHTLGFSKSGVMYSLVGHGVLNIHTYTNTCKHACASTHTPTQYETGSVMILVIRIFHC